MYLPLKPAPMAGLNSEAMDLNTAVLSRNAVNTQV